MFLRPCNRYLVVEPIEEDQLEDNPRILLPDDYKQSNPFGIGRIVGRATDCSVEAFEGEIITFSSNMLEKISINGENFSLLLENYVLGILSEIE
jgi:co-chaperonin GroES (HSP10)|tara:strand:+ start:292 stop:573 length:282 start_codon:yes stop_codon:yes gene_type:complete